MENERRVMCAGFLFAFIITSYNVQSDLLRHFPPSSKFPQPLSRSHRIFLQALYYSITRRSLTFGIFSVFRSARTPRISLNTVMSAEGLKKEFNLI